MQLIVLLSGLLLMAFSTSAQEFTDDKKVLSDYQESINALLKKGSTISAPDALMALTSPHQLVDISYAKSPKKPITGHELYTLAKKSTIVVGCSYLCPRCSNAHISESSGYIIDPNGIVVTNYHVALTYADMKDGYKPLAFTIRLANGQVYAVKSILAASKENDLAVIQVETNGEKFPALTLADAAQVGDRIYVLGHPKGMHYFFSEGIVTNKYMEEAGTAEKHFFREMMAISADYATGSSGGPVLDIYGRVVGTVSNTKMFTHSETNPSVQMVIKNTIPVESLWKLLRSGSNH